MKTTKLIDSEARKLIDKNYARTRTLLEENIDILHAMAQALVKYETIDSGQLDQLMARETVSAPDDWDDTGETGGRF